MTQTPTFDYAPVAADFAAALAHKFSEPFEVQVGPRYARVVQGTGYGQHVHAFVERATGTLLKAAGWKAPAKGARGDLSTPEGFADAVGRADRFGSYLYA